jgi:predicted transcriptional regulator
MSDNGEVRATGIHAFDMTEAIGIVDSMSFAVADVIDTGGRVDMEFMRVLGSQLNLLKENLVYEAGKTEALVKKLEFVKTVLSLPAKQQLKLATEEVSLLREKRAYEAGKTEALVTKLEHAKKKQRLALLAAMEDDDDDDEESVGVTYHRPRNARLSNHISDD